MQATSANPSRSPLPDLVSDSLVTEHNNNNSRRLQSSLWPSGSASESATQQLCSSNPFTVEVEQQQQFSTNNSETSIAQVQEEQLLGEASSPSSSSPPHPSVNYCAKPLGIVRPISRTSSVSSSATTLIFNFENIVEVAQTATGGGGYTSEMCDSGDLIPLNLSGSGGGGACANDENVINALREAEGSIRKLELAAEGGVEGNAVENGHQEAELPSESGLFSQSFRRNKNNAEEILQYNSNNNHHQYEEGFMCWSDPQVVEHELLMNHQRRYRSHSETEATISIFDRLLSQQRRMLLSQSKGGGGSGGMSSISSNNNPFLSPDLLQHENGAPWTMTRNPLIRSNGMMMKQNFIEDQQQQQQQMCSRALTNSNPHPSSSSPAADEKPYALSKTVSETYLGQFMAASALPRSSSILQLLEQQQQLNHGPPSPTLPWAAFMDMNGSGGGGRERNGKSGAAAGGWNNSSKQNTRRRSSMESGAGAAAVDVSAIERVNLLANSCAGSGGYFKRTLSSESVSSQSSVLITDLESSTSAAVGGVGPGGVEQGLRPPPVTGYLCVGLQYDK